MTNPLEVRQPGGRPAGGQYAARERSESNAILSSPLHQLGEDSEWKNGGQGHGISIVESPISDRERNYWISFESAANRTSYINVSPVEFGIEHPELGQSNDNDRLYIGTENSRGDGTLEVQYSADVDTDSYAEEIMELEAEGELEEFETEILNALRKETGDENIDIQFSSGGETWDDVAVLYNHKIVDELPIHDINPDGSIEASTSNLMAHLEGSAAYNQVVHGRIGDDIVQRLISQRFPQND